MPSIKNITKTATDPFDDPYKVFANTALDSIQFYIYDHLGNTRLTYFANKPASSWRYHLVNVMDYYPYGKTLKTYNLNTAERYQSTGHERDTETGWDYRLARLYDADVGRFLGVDPLASERSWLNPYNYVQGSPVIRVDPDGALDGWIQDDNGQVFWDSNTNSQEEFNQNYKGKNDYSYVSDDEDPGSYILPNGDGILRINLWEVYGIEGGMGGPNINLEFIPFDKDCSSGWFQTFSSNVPDVTSETVYSVLPQENIEERLDEPMIKDKTNLSQAVCFDNPPSNILDDLPGRRLNEGAKRNVVWKAQSSVIINGKRSFTVGWGFEISSQNEGTFYVPLILKSVTKFQKEGINNL
jgi:RHS repeat-associated protein